MFFFSFIFFPGLMKYYLLKKTAKPNLKIWEIIKSTTKLPLNVEFSDVFNAKDGN